MTILRKPKLLVPGINFHYTMYERLCSSWPSLSMRTEIANKSI